MTPCELRGWKVGDQFIVDTDNFTFKLGSIIELYEDDGSDSPLFKLISGYTRYRRAGGLLGAYICLNYIKPVVGARFITNTFTFRPEGKRMTDNCEELKRKEELKRQLAETRAQMDRLEAELKREEQWEPKGGSFYVAGSGNVQNLLSARQCREFGTERPTRELAERARDLMRTHNRALAYVHEHAPNWDGSDPHFVGWSNCLKKYSTLRGTGKTPGTVYGPEWVIRQFADDINSGRVVL